VLPYRRLADRVWGYEAVDDASLLKGHIRNLRRKLERDPADPEYLQTVTGIGYTFQSCRPPGEAASTHDHLHRSRRTTGHVTLALAAALSA
jgi:DNA-binding winged helix-turn-helix (wHTH) protein